MKYMKRIAALILVAAIIFTGCGGDTSWAFRSGDAEIPVGLYMLYQMDAFYDANEQIQKEATGDTAGSSYLEPQEILKKTIEGKNASDWIAEKAQKTVREHIAVAGKFKEMGLELTEAETASAANSAASLNSQSNKAFYSDNGISEKSLVEYYTHYIRSYRVFNAIYGEGGTQGVPESELKDYFKTNYAMINVFLMYKPEVFSGDETTEPEMTEAEVKAAAEDYLKRLEAGEAIEELYYEWEQKNADEETRQLIQKPEKGDLSMIISEKERENFGDELMDALMGLNTGKPQLIDDPAYYLLADRVDIMADESVFEGYKNSLLQEIKYEEYMNSIAEWGELERLETNNAAINRYKPSKINFKNLNA